MSKNSFSQGRVSEGRANDPRNDEPAAAVNEAAQKLHGVERGPLEGEAERSSDGAPLDAERLAVKNDLAVLEGASGPSRSADAYDFTFNLAPDDFLHIASFERTGVKAWIFDSVPPDHIVFTEEITA
jgi:hypothetical protein